MGSEAKFFNDAMDEMLIEFVRVHPVLYLPKDPGYKDNALKDKVWQEIATILRRTAMECKTRWRTIRDSYKKAKNKMEAKSNSHGFWAYPRSKYNTGCLSFLDDSFKERAVSTSKLYLERLAKLNGVHPLLFCEDSGSQDRGKQDESSKSDSHDPPIKREVIDLDDTNEDNKDRIHRVTEDDRYIIPDPTPQIETSPLVHLRQLLVPEIELGVVETADPNCDIPVTESSDKSKEDNRLQEHPLNEIVAEPDAKVVRKRVANLDPRSSESSKRKRKDGPERDSNSVKGEGTVHEHPIETFFRSMASTVMTFPPRIVAETRLEVCRIVTEMELRFLAQQNDSFVPRIVDTGPAPSESESSAP